MKKILTLLLTMTICGLGFTGCVLKKYTSIATLDMGTPVRALPLTADLNISEQKVRGEAHGYIGTGADEDRIVREATARALGQDPPKVEAPDVLVAMNVYKEQRGRDLKVVVTGYPAWYHNFRTVGLGGGKMGESDSAWLILMHSGSGGGMTVGAASDDERQPTMLGKLNFSKTLKSVGTNTEIGGGGSYYIGVNKTFGPRSLMNDWATIEAGWLRSGGLFYGFEFGGGVIDDYSIGGGFNIGYTYDLSAGFSVSAGGSVGCWGGEYYRYEDYYQYSIGFGGPFVRLRWRFIEISYRGLMGYMDEEEYHYDYYNGSHYDYNEGFAWLSQLKAGFHFEF